MRDMKPKVGIEITSEIQIFHVIAYLKPYMCGGNQPREELQVFSLCFTKACVCISLLLMSSHHRTSLVDNEMW